MERDSSRSFKGKGNSGGGDDDDDDDDGDEPQEQSFWTRIKPKLKIMIAFCQLVSSMGFNIGVNIPDHYTSVLSVLSFSGLDFFDVMPLDCLVETNYYSHVVVNTAGPIFIVLVLMMLRCCFRRTGGNVFFSLILLLLYLVLPSSSSSILRVYKCDHFPDTDEWFLASDYRISCEGGARTGWLVYTGLMMAIFPIGIPVVFAVLLYTERHKLCPRLASEGWRFLFFRNDSWNLDVPLGTGNSRVQLLASPYEDRCFWFEVFECYRRLLLSSMLILLYSLEAAQIVVAIFICLLSIRVYSYYDPFVSDDDDSLAEMAQWQLFCVFFASLLIRLEATSDDPRDQEALSFLLISITGVGFVLMLWLTFAQNFKSYFITSEKGANGVKPAETEAETAADESHEVFRIIELLKAQVEEPDSVPLTKSQVDYIRAALLCKLDDEDEEEKFDATNPMLLVADEVLETDEGKGGAVEGPEDDDEDAEIVVRLEEEDEDEEDEEEEDSSSSKTEDVVAIVEPRLLTALQGCSKKAFLKARAFVAKNFGEQADAQAEMLVFSRESPAIMCERAMGNPLVRLLASKAYYYELKYRDRTAAGKAPDSPAAGSSDENPDWLDEFILKSLEAARHGQLSPEPKAKANKNSGSRTISF
jgi:hypothetical protein